MLASEENATPSSAIRGKAFQFVFVFVVATYLLTPIYEARVFGHIVTGRWIFTNNAIANTDLWTNGIFNPVFLGTTWLFDLLIGVTDKLTGPTGLILLKIIILALVIGSASYVCSVLARDRFVGTGIAAIASLGALIINPLTPELFALGFFIYFLFKAKDYFEAPSNKKLINLFFLTLLYSNLHLSVYFAILASLFLKTKLLNSIKPTVIYLTTIIIASLIKPYPIVQLKMLPLTFKAFLGEMVYHLNPATIFNYETGIYLVIIVFFVFLWTKKLTALNSSELILAVISFFLALANRANLPYAIYLIALLASLLWGRSEKSLFGKFNEGVEKLKAKAEKFPLQGGVFLLFSMAVFLGAKTISIPVTEALLPERETQFLLEHKEFLPVLSSPQIGSYLRFKFADQNGNALARIIWDENIRYSDYNAYLEGLALYKLESDWNSLLERTSPQSIVCPSKSPLCFMLRNNSHFKQVFPNKDSRTRYLYAIFAPVD